MKRRCKFENVFLQASSTLWSAVQEVSSLVEVTLLLSNQRAISCKNLYKLTTLNPSSPVCFLILRPTNSIVFKLLSNLEIIFATISSRLTRFSVLVFNCCGLRLTSSCNAAAFLKLSSSHHIIFENRLRQNLSFDYMPTLEREAQITLLRNHQSFDIILIDLISET